jgi:hypothetical protein
MSSKPGFLYRTALAAGLGIAALGGMALAAAPAQAHGWKHAYVYSSFGGYYVPGYVVASPYAYYAPPPVVYYPPPPAVYAPPPVYVAPAPVYYAPPSLSFGISIPLH